MDLRRQLDRLDLAGFEIELAGHGSGNAGHSLLVTCGVGVAHLDRCRERADDGSGECCLTLLQLLPLGDVDDDDCDADDGAAHGDWIQVGEPVVSSVGVRGSRA